MANVFDGDYLALLKALQTIRVDFEMDGDVKNLCGCGSSEISIVWINDDQIELPICKTCASGEFLKTHAREIHNADTPNFTREAVSTVSKEQFV